MILTNLAVLFARTFPVAGAPLVTTFIGFAVQILLVALIALRMGQLELDVTATVLLTAALAVLPHVGEITANSTNLQWLVAALAVIILLDRERHHARFSGPTLFIGGLSGLAPALLLPAFAAKWWLDRSRSSAIELACLLASTGIIVFLAARYGVQLSARTYPLDPLLYFKIISTQTTSLLLGFNSAVALTHWYSVNPVEAFFVSFGVVAIIVMLFLFGLSRPYKRRATILLALAYFFSVCASIFGAINPPALIAPTGRYFFVPNMVLLILIAHLAGRSHRWLGFAVFAFLIGVNWVPKTALPGIYFEGPAWRNQIPADGIRTPTTIEIWPRGWSIVLTP